MKGRDMEALYARAVEQVRQSHLDRLRACGVAPAVLAELGLGGAPFGVFAGEIEREGRFLPGEGRNHVVQPVAEGGVVIDLVAWRPDEPTRWGLVSGNGWLLNADHAFASRWDGDRLSLLATPLAWLRAGGSGATVLDWSTPDLAWLNGFARIDCDNDVLSATLRRALAKPVRLPLIRSEVRNVA